MRKLLGAVSAAMVMGCVFALANANDDVNSNSNNGTSDMNSQSAMVHQQPGTAADSTNVDGNTTPGPDEHMGTNSMKSESTTTTTTTRKTAMNKKSCTDQNGKVFLKGHPGFKACVKAQKKAQMGGTLGRNLNDDSSNSDLNHNDTSSTPNNQ